MIEQHDNVFKTHAFTFAGEDYVAAAFTKPSDPDTIRVEVSRGGTQVVITYPDGFRASLVYTVTLMTSVDLSINKNINAVDNLLATAEHDIRQLVTPGV